LVFIGAFLVGELLHLPGMLFFATGVLIWGRLLGGVIGGATALLSVVFTFMIVRVIGGQPLSKPTRPFMQRILAHLADRPISTVAMLRMVFFLTPSVTYALALSPIRFGQMMLGSAIGLAPPLTIIALLSERVMHWLQTR
ncbi:MAG: VTT domain-containing protein, partial [Polyangia bacterium]